MTPEETKRLQLQRELSVRDLTPEEIAEIFKNAQATENLVRDRYPELFNRKNDQEDT
jgi:hypothetical protein